MDASSQLTAAPSNIETSKIDTSNIDTIQTLAESEKLALAMAQDHSKNTVDVQGQEEVEARIQMDVVRTIEADLPQTSYGTQECDAYQTSGGKNDGKIADMTQAVAPNEGNALEDYGRLYEEQNFPQIQGISQTMEQQFAQFPQFPPQEENDSTRITAYAKLEFEDGAFYMNTYSIILGRDVQAARAAMRRDEQENHEPYTPVRVKHEESKYSKSVVSETGGILRDFGDSDSNKPTRKKKSRKASRKSKSTGSSSQHGSRRNSVVQPDRPIIYQPQVSSRRADLGTVGAASLDLASLRTSPYECPTIGIHPAASAPVKDYKAISRKHVKIAYNNPKEIFEAEILGRNGAFIDDEFCNYADVKELKTGCYLQIGSVRVRFVLPDSVAPQTYANETSDHVENMGNDRYSQGGKEMSFEFEDGIRNGIYLNNTSEESSDEEDTFREHRNLPEAEDEDEEEDYDDRPEVGERLDHMEDDDLEEAADTNENEKDAPISVPKPDKKRGPGRPPKNGIMSKREQQLAKKEALAQQKQKVKNTVEEPIASIPPPGKNKVGRPRKHPRPDTPPVQREKRKYTKRKPKEPKDPNSNDADQSTKEKKEKKPAKPSRSPSPEMHESDYTPEQLVKPPLNYVILIHEALRESKRGSLNLQGIYKAIYTKYPYYRFKVDTLGWQSSVRHNVQQCDAFVRGEKDGKGFFWSLDPNVPIEKEKKKRASPPSSHPQMHHQQIYQAGYYPQMMPTQGYQYGPPPPGYGGYPIPPGGPQMQHPQFTSPYPPGSHLPPPMAQPPMNGNLPPSFPVPPQLAPANQSTYSSPYAPKPIAPLAPPPTHVEAQFVTPQNQIRPNVANMITRKPENPRQLEPSQQSDSEPTLQTSPPSTDEINIGVQELAKDFGAVVAKILTGKTDKAEAIAESVVNRMQGFRITTSVHDHSHEQLLVESLTKLFRSQAGYGVDLEQHQSLPLANQIGTQGNATKQPVKSTGEEPSTSVVMRLSLTSRLNGSSIPRPPMKTPAMQETNSESQVNAPSRQSAPPVAASPAPTALSLTAPTTNGASTPKLFPNGDIPPAEQNIPHDGSEDMSDFQRLNRSGQHADLKRPLEDMDDDGESRKRLRSSPPNVKTDTMTVDAPEGR